MGDSVYTPNKNDRTRTHGGVHQNAPAQRTNASGRERVCEQNRQQRCATKQPNKWRKALFSFFQILEMYKVQANMVIYFRRYRPFVLTELKGCNFEQPTHKLSDQTGHFQKVKRDTEKVEDTIHSDSFSKAVTTSRLFHQHSRQFPILIN